MVQRVENLWSKPMASKLIAQNCGVKIDGSAIVQTWALFAEPR
jgi:hypothetical protein